MRYVLLIFCLLVTSVMAAPAQAGGQPGREEIDFDGVGISVFTYRPDGCAPTGMLLIFHGLSRNADRYRDWGIGLADRQCLLVLAPLFDKDRFPNWSYQLGGVSAGDGKEKQAAWTVAYVPRLIAWARQWSARQDLPVYLFGHSAGAQFLSRFAAYGVTEGVARIVVANPSSHVLASLTDQAPFGFGGLFEEGERQGRLRRYLATPVTVYLGGSDTGDKNLLTDDNGRRQGANRYERGQNTFAWAGEAARQNAWEFNWRFVVAPGVAHSAKGMLNADAAAEAFGFPAAARGQ